MSELPSVRTRVAERLIPSCAFVTLTQKTRYFQSAAVRVICDLLQQYYIYFDSPFDALSNAVFRIIKKRLPTMLCSDEKYHLRRYRNLLWGIFARPLCFRYVVLYYVFHIFKLPVACSFECIFQFRAARFVYEVALCRLRATFSSSFSPALSRSHTVVRALQIMFYSISNCSYIALSNAVFVVNIEHSSKKLYCRKHACFTVLKPKRWRLLLLYFR